MEFEINNKCIHDDDFFTFETSWMGEVNINIEEGYALIPILNLDVENKKILDFLNVKLKKIYIEKSYLKFTQIKSIYKELAIHNPIKGLGFIDEIQENITLKKSDDKINQFEFGCFGIYQNYTCDGIIKVECNKCYYVLPDDIQYRVDYKSQNKYLPFNKSTLNFLSKA